MEDKIKSIEEKLDFIIEIFKVNPDYESYVKNALRNKEIERIKIDVPLKNAKRKEKIVNYIFEILENKTMTISLIRIGFMSPQKGIAPNPFVLSFEKELIEWIAEIYNNGMWSNSNLHDLIQDKSLCPLFQAKIIELFGEELSVEKCIEELPI